MILSFFGPNRIPLCSVLSVNLVTSHSVLHVPPTKNLGHLSYDCGNLCNFMLILKKNFCCSLMVMCYVCVQWHAPVVWFSWYWIAWSLCSTSDCWNMSWKASASASTRSHPILSSRRRTKADWICRLWWVVFVTLIGSLGWYDGWWWFGWVWKFISQHHPQHLDMVSYFVSMWCTVPVSCWHSSSLASTAESPALCGGFSLLVRILGECFFFGWRLTCAH